MQILPVTDKITAKLFLKVPSHIYEKNPNWIQPLDKDIEDVFDKKKNKAFRFGDAIRWILKDHEGRLIGRIAAFHNKKYKNKGDVVHTGGVGFFECINQQDAADLLFDNAKHWLMSNNIEAMDGPINFGERDKWWGLVTEGYHAPMYGMNYNPPYYKTLFENYGFKEFYQQLCMGLDPKKPLQTKIWERHRIIDMDENYSACYIDKGDLKKFAGDFAEVYNKAWAGHGGLKEISKDQVWMMFNKMKPVMDEKIIWFAYYKKEPIAIFINLPDLNQWFKYLHGKFGWWQKLYFLLLKNYKKNTKFTGLVFGIVPSFQGKGIDAYIIGESAKIIQSNKNHYTSYEMQWIGDFNPKMLNIAQNLGDVFVSRRLTTYRYLFDRTIPFKRHPILS
jgi:hypothetical protein